MIKDLIESIEVTPEEHTRFVLICSEWGMYCEALSYMDRFMVMKLIHYLIDERQSGKHLLRRALGRFNRLNLLQKEDLL